MIRGRKLIGFTEVIKPLSDGKCLIRDTLLGNARVSPHLKIPAYLAGERNVYKEIENTQKSKSVTVLVTMA
jgi:hypothetical protein